jgi:hypothetical protein
MLQGAVPVAAVIVAVFEFMFYGCIILGVAAPLHSAWRWFKGLAPRGDQIV